MTIAAQLVARLASVTTNLFPLEAPKDFSTPVCTYTSPAIDPIRDLGGTVGDWVHFVIETYDPSYLTAKALAAEIRENLESWQEEDVQVAALLDETDAIDKTTSVTLYRIVQSYLVLNA